MKTLFIVLFLIGTSLSQVHAQSMDFNYHRDFKNILEQTQNPKSDLNYDKLFPRYWNDDTTLTHYEMLALLIGFTSSEHFRPYSYLSTERWIYDLNEEEKFDEAIAACDSFLSFVPFSQRALYEKAYAFHRLEQKDSSKAYFKKFERIMVAMIESGDGLTPETAHFSLGPTDGQNLIRKVYRAGIGTMGSGSDEHGNFVDILEMVWEDKDTGERRSRDLFFQIQHATNTMFADFDMDSLDLDGFDNLDGAKKDEEDEEDAKEGKEKEKVKKKKGKKKKK